MKKNILGKTGFKVSHLGFGTLPMGPLQLNLPLKKGVEIIQYALEKGINFIDTAHIYGTYKYIKYALKKVKQKVFIASKTNAKEYQEVEKQIQNALKQMNLKYLDIFLIHAPRINNPFEERSFAWKCLIDYKKKGLIKAIGLSSHSVKAIESALEIKELDIIHPLINFSGLGILDGTKKEMLSVIKKAQKKEIGIYTMKSLAGGNLIDNRIKSLNFVLKQKSFHSIMIGMVKKDEVDYNVKFFNFEKIPNKLSQDTKKQTKKITILPFCKKCGKCIDTCPNKSLSMGENKPIVNKRRCLLCGYCTVVCPEFFIRLA
ncbi:MAG: aldo/keto reductase [bacterium]